MKELNSGTADTEKLDLLAQKVVEGDYADQTVIMDTAADIVFHQTKRMMDTIIDYKELMMMYTCAIKEVQTKFEVFNTEFNVRYRRNPISSINTRMKKMSSIVEKLNRQGQSFSVESVEKNIHDVAGVRIICAYIDDIYTIADSLLKQDDITLVARKDYIANPKPNGYRSLHLIVRVPVFFAEQKKSMKVEVQIRTIAMDFWASLEHQLKYKQEIMNEQEIIGRLKACAETINATDKEMQNIRRQIEEAEDAPTEEEIMIEKLHKLDFSI